MSKVRPPYPAEFRQQMVELVRAGRSPTELSREFGVTAQSITNRVAQTAIDSGKPLPGKEGLTTAEREELVRLSLHEAVEQARTERTMQTELGVDQAALDEAARRGFAMGAFEDVEDDGLPIIEEFFQEAAQEDVRTSGLLNGDRAVLRDKLSFKANRIESDPVG